MDNDRPLFARVLRRLYRLFVPLTEEEKRIAERMAAEALKIEEEKLHFKQLEASRRAILDGTDHY